MLRLRPQGKNHCCHTQQQKTRHNNPRHRQNHHAIAPQNRGKARGLRTIRPCSEPTGPAKILLRHDNLRAGVGDFSPHWAQCPSRTAGLLAHSVKPTRTLGLAHGFSSPSRSYWQMRKGGRFVDKEASNPGTSLCHSSGFSGFSKSRHRPHHAARHAAISPNRMKNPRCSTVAGSATFNAPEMGPRLRIPFCFPPRTSSRQKPSTNMVMPKTEICQSDP